MPCEVWMAHAMVPHNCPAWGFGGRGTRFSLSCSSVGKRGGEGMTQCGCVGEVSLCLSWCALRAGKVSVILNVLVFDISVAPIKTSAN